MMAVDQGVRVFDGAILSNAVERFGAFVHTDLSRGLHEALELRLIRCLAGRLFGRLRCRLRLHHRTGAIAVRAHYMGRLAAVV